MSFLGEIKRRKIFQVASFYLMLAWLIMQIVNVVNELLRLPDSDTCRQPDAVHTNT